LALESSDAERVAMNRRKTESRYREADEVREAICLARGWEFKL
jgi:hypothetical protein